MFRKSFLILCFDLLSSALEYCCPVTIIFLVSYKLHSRLLLILIHFQLLLRFLYLSVYYLISILFDLFP